MMITFEPFDLTEEGFQNDVHTQIAHRIVIRREKSVIIKRPYSIHSFHQHQGKRIEINSLLLDPRSFNDHCQ